MKINNSAKSSDFAPNHINAYDRHRETFHFVWRKIPFAFAVLGLVKAGNEIGPGVSDRERESLSLSRGGAASNVLRNTRSVVASG